MRVVAVVKPHDGTRCGSSPIKTIPSRAAQGTNTSAMWTMAKKTIVWLILLSVEIVASLVAPYWVYVDVGNQVGFLLYDVYATTGVFDPGPGMASWDSSAYTGANRTAAQNEVLMRRLLDTMATTARTFAVPKNETPIAMALAKILFLQSVTLTNHTDMQDRYSIMIVKSFTMGNPIYSPLEALVLMIRVRNRVVGFETLKVFRVTSTNATHESLEDVSVEYARMIGPTKYVLCVRSFDANTIKCGAVILTPAIEASLTLDTAKMAGTSNTLPSCTHPGIPNLVYSLSIPFSDTSRVVQFFCASDLSVSDLLGFNSWTAVTNNPRAKDQKLLWASMISPTGYRMPFNGVGFLDSNPNATAEMVPMVNQYNYLWMGATSRVDYIVQTQIALLVLTRLITIVAYLALLCKRSYTTNQNLLVVLVDYFSLEVTNTSGIDTTVGIALLTTYWTYQDMITAMVHQQLMNALPWSKNNAHTYVDDLRFIPGNVAFIFIVALCVTKHILNACRLPLRLAYVTLWLVAAMLVAGAVVHEGPVMTSIRTAEPYAFTASLVVPMARPYYRFSQHFEAYVYMFYAVVVGIPLAVGYGRMTVWYAERRLANGPSLAGRYSTFDEAVGLDIRIPGGFTDPSRLYVHGGTTRSTAYSVMLSGYIEIDGCLMQVSSAQRCLLSFCLGRSTDTAGAIYFYKLNPARTTVLPTIYRTFPSKFIRGKTFWRVFKSLALPELD